MAREHAQPVGKPGTRPGHADEALDVLATAPATRRAFHAPHLELTGQIAERSARISSPLTGWVLGEPFLTRRTCSVALGPP
jgi:hypothetical protein